MLLERHQSWRSSRQVFAEALRLVVVHWKSLAWLWLCQIGFFIVWLFLVLVLPDVWAAKSFLVSLAYALLAIVQLAISACQIYLVADRKKRTLRAIVRESVMPHLPALAAMTVLVAVATVVATFAGIIPGIVLYIFWSMAIFVLLLEGTTVRVSLQRSVQLVRGWWWPMLQRYLFWFTILTVQTLMSLVPMAGPIVSGALSLFIIPATIFYFYLTYQELTGIKQYKHLMVAQMSFIGKLLLVLWALAIFAAFAVVSV